MEREKIVQEIHRSARRKYKRRHFIMIGIFETISADLVDMQKYAKQNKGYKYILTVIDHFSKFAFALPLKSKTGPSVKVAMEKILSQGRVPKHLHTDDGKEFFNVHFQKLMKKYGINHYVTYSGLKAAIVERFNRTLKNKMWPHFDLQGNVKWLNLLPKLVDEYNHTSHRTIKMAPVEVNKDNEKKLLQSVYKHVKTAKKKPKFKIGDFVRVSKHKLLFEKGYTANYSMEVFKIVKVKLSNPRTYLLEDLEETPIKGAFYEEELLKTQFPHTYLVEKVLRKNKNKYLVKWRGFEKNSWIDKDDII